MPNNIKRAFLTEALHLIPPWFFLAFYSCNLRSVSSIHAKVLSILTLTALQYSPEVRGLRGGKWLLEQYSSVSDTRIRGQKLKFFLIPQPFPSRIFFSECVLVI